MSAAHMHHTRARICSALQHTLQHAYLQHAYNTPCSILLQASATAAAPAQKRFSKTERLGIPNVVEHPPSAPPTAGMHTTEMCWPTVADSALGTMSKATSEPQLDCTTPQHDASPRQISAWASYLGRVQTSSPSAANRGAVLASNSSTPASVISECSTLCANGQQSTAEHVERLQEL